MIAFTQQLALHNASYGIRANVILPGLMDTPMAVDTRARATNRSRAEVAAERDASVPLRGRMGTAWDVANAALFLASDEANFITGAASLSMAVRWSGSADSVSGPLSEVRLGVFTAASQRGAGASGSKGSSGAANSAPLKPIAARKAARTSGGWPVWKT